MCCAFTAVKEQTCNSLEIPFCCLSGKKTGPHISIQPTFSSQRGRKKKGMENWVLPPNTFLHADPRQIKLPPYSVTNSILKLLTHVQLKYKTLFCLWTQLHFKPTSALQAARGICVHTPLVVDYTPFWCTLAGVCLKKKSKNQLISDTEDLSCISEVIPQVN